MMLDSLHINILQGLSGLLVVMDPTSKFIYLNNYTAKMFGFQEASNALGKNAFQINCPANESANNFITQDNLVISKNRPIKVFDIHEYANGEKKIFLTTKTPFKQNNAIGVISHSVEISDALFHKAYNELINLNTKHQTPLAKKSQSYIINNPTFQDNKLTQRQMDCLFYLSRGYSIKQIANELQLSPRTVEHYLENIKLKLACTNRSHLIEYALSNGYLNYIPKNLFSKIVSNSIHLLE
jgi:DNA-binding CsgD family transcriptional regulator